MALATAPRTRKPDLMELTFEQAGVEIREEGLRFFWLVGSQSGREPYRVSVDIKDTRMARADAEIRCECVAARDFGNTLCAHVRCCEKRLALRQAL